MTVNISDTEKNDVQNDESFATNIIDHPSFLSNLFKGATIGKILTAKLFRYAFLSTFIIFDMIIGTFIPSYYELDVAYLTDFDGNRRHPISGFMGEAGYVMGFGIGWTIGMILGAVLYPIDMIAVNLINGFRAVYKLINDYMTFVEKDPTLKELLIFKERQLFGSPFMTKLVNMSAAIIGLPLAYICWLPCRAIEYFLKPLLGPNDKSLSQGCLKLVTGVVGTLGAGSVFFLAIIFLIAGRVADSYESIRNGVRSASALAYAKNDILVLVQPDNPNTPRSITIYDKYSGEKHYSHTSELFKANDYNNDYIQKYIHTKEFSQEVEAFKKASYVDLMVGPLASNKEKREEVEPLLGKNGARTGESTHYLSKLIRYAGTRLFSRTEVTLESSRVSNATDPHLRSVLRGEDEEVSVEFNGMTPELGNSSQLN